MSKKEKNAPLEEQEKNTCPDQPQEVTEEYRPEETAEETFTVTKEQMEKMEKLAGQLAVLNDQHLRLAAEYDNYRKRTTREKETIYQDAKMDTIAKFLEVYDNLERALKQDTADEAYKKGVEMTMNQLKEILSKLGITEIPALGQPFDPKLHNAVMHVEDESLGENVVAAVFQAGFQCGEKVIRFAMVQVAN